MKIDRTSMRSGSLGLFLLLFLSANSFADNKNTAHYAVVDMQSVILNVTEGKQAREKLEKEIKRTLLQKTIKDFFSKRDVVIERKNI